MSQTPQPPTTIDDLIRRRTTNATTRTKSIYSSLTILTSLVPNGAWSSQNFMLGAGMVIIQPKGRKDLGESLEITALREAYEEVCPNSILQLTCFIRVAHSPWILVPIIPPVVLWLLQHTHIALRSLSLARTLYQTSLLFLAMVVTMSPSYAAESKLKFHGLRSAVSILALLSSACNILLVAVVGGAVRVVRAMPVVVVGVPSPLFVVVVVVTGPIPVVIHPASRCSQRWWWGAVDGAVSLL